MPKYAITCPKCRTKFALSSDNPDALLSQTFRCPKCGGSTPFTSVFKKKAGAPGTQPSVTDPGPGRVASGPHTQIGAGAPVAGGHTRVAAGGAVTGGPHTAPQGFLEIMGPGRRIPLHPGSHILGRASSDSQATLQVAPDPYMSRAHARIIVGAISGRLQCQLTPAQSRNAVFVNDRRIPAGEAVMLKNGDVILLGMTKLKFVNK